MPKGVLAKDGDVRLAPNHYHYTKVDGAWRLTHHLTAEKKLGRPLEDNERVTFADGDRTNYLDPDNIIVSIKGTRSYKSRAARLRARIAELQAELDDLESQ